MKTGTLHTTPLPLPPSQKDFSAITIDINEILAEIAAWEQVSRAAKKARKTKKRRDYQIIVGPFIFFIILLALTILFATWRF